MNLALLYQHRFLSVNLTAKQAAWSEISHYLFHRTGSPEVVMDSSCGAGEFINAIPATERWAVDMVAPDNLADEVHFVQDAFQNAQLPNGHFDMVFASNVLEHLRTPEEIQDFMTTARRILVPEGQFVVMGPNFRHCFRTYFDCADHILPLTHVSVSEHLAAAGFRTLKVHSKFMPYSFRSRLPNWAWLVRAYLRFPPAWWILGRQFLIVATPAPN